MTKEEDQAEKNPYKLSPEALRPPETGVRKWFRDLVALQREGIDQGIMPQNIRCVTEEMQEAWVNRVWDYYLSKLPPEERVRIRGTTRPAFEIHSHKGPFHGGGIPYDEDQGSPTIID
jgi:hypothetical protein